MWNLKSRVGPNTVPPTEMFYFKLHRVANGPFAIRFNRLLVVDYLKSKYGDSLTEVSDEGRDILYIDETRSEQDVNA